MKRKGFILFSVLVTCLMTIGSGTENPPRVMNFMAVMDLRCGKEISKDQCAALTEVLIDELVKIKKYKVIDRANRDKILAEAGYQQTACVDNSCTIEIGRQLGVGRMVVGSVTKLGETYLINLQLLNVETASVDESTKEKCDKCPLENLIDTITQAAHKIMMEETETPAVTPNAGPTPPSEAAVGKGSVSISTSPPGADIYLDATPMGKTPKTLADIPAGTHQLTLVLAGYSPLNKGVAVRAGATATVSEILSRQTGSIDITSAPQGASVWVDGKYVGKTPMKIPSVGVGKHSVKIAMQDYQDYTGEVSVEANGTAAVNQTLQGLPGKILVTSTPDGAEVFVDSRKVGVTPYSGQLDAGNHSIRIGAQGYQIEEKAVTIIPNKPMTLNVALKKISVPIVSTPTRTKAAGRGGAPSGMVLIPAGAFMMGCNERVDKQCGSYEKPYHKVYLDAYSIDKYEVTVDQYKACVNSGQCTAADTRENCNYDKSDRGNHPINCVAWNQADAYCKGAGKRLPTEAEWEKAARGTDGRKYPWGNQEASCNYAVMNENGNGCGRDLTWPVGSKPAGASPYGAMDMAGNVWEWVGDWYDANYYRNSPNRNPTGPTSGQYRVLRGGSWPADPLLLRSSLRYWRDPDLRGGYGFRCARTQ